MFDVDVLVLAGGLGSRLDGVLTGLPKILAPIDGRPFLEYLLDWLQGQGVVRVILGLGHRAEPVHRYLAAHSWKGLEVIPVVEPRPLGTAGAVGFAYPSLHSNPVLVMNGDTVVEADLGAFVASHRQSGAAASVLCAKVEDAGRYGRIEIDADDRIVRFEEKNTAASEPSWVNAGMYLFHRTMLDQIARLESGSLERDVLEGMPAGSVHAFQTAGRFLDIGTPQSLAQAAAFLSQSELAGKTSHS
jgi:NDP-sugar pyrophosphorylase family protein